MGKLSFPVSGYSKFNQVEEYVLLVDLVSFHYSSLKMWSLWPKKVQEITKYH